MKKTTKNLVIVACAIGAVAFSTKVIAVDSPAKGCTMGSCCSGMGMTMVGDANTNAIPDLLTTCPVSGDKLGGDMGKPYVFVYQGQEVKLCCPSCKKDFDKDPNKYLKTIRAADKK